MKKLTEWLIRIFKLPTVLTLTKQEVLYKEMQRHCPACKTDPPIYNRGPEGGLSINIFCAHCGQGYNVSPPIEWAEQIHKDVRYVG